MLKRRFNAAFTELVERTHLIFCQVFTIDEVRHAVSRLKYDKATVFDGVTLEMVIYAGESIVVQLTCLFNLCLKHGFVSESFTKSIIVLVLKVLINSLNLTHLRIIVLSRLYVFKSV